MRKTLKVVGMYVVVILSILLITAMTLFGGNVFKVPVP